MRFLIASVGSNGDMNPYVGVGAALRERGHEVALIAQPYFERMVREAGLEFVAAGERFDLSLIAENPGMMAARTGSVRILRGFVIPAAADMYRVANECIANARPDAIFCHHLAFGPIWAAKGAGVPFAVGSLTPLMFLSAHDRCVYDASGRETRPGFINTLRRRMILFISGLLYDAPLNRMRRELGLPKLRDQLTRDVWGAPLTLGLWSEQFRAPMVDDPPRAKICGFVWHDRHREQEHAPKEIERFLDDGEPPVIFTLGSTAVHVAGPFYEAAAGACAKLGRRGLLLTGKREYAPRKLPPGVAAFTYAPFSAVLPRGCATVHHGGIGTTAQAMRAGRPTVIVPFAHDQFDNAARERRLGVSATVPRTQVSADSLAAALGRVLADPECLEKAAALGRALSSEDGAAVSAGSLERLGSDGKLQQIANAH